MVENNNNNQNVASDNSQSSASEPINSSIWTTVNTSTTINVERLEIRKSEDFDRIVKKSS